jgi:GAF domain-containing protein
MTDGLQLVVGTMTADGEEEGLQVALVSSMGPEGQIRVGPKATAMAYDAGERAALTALADHAAMALLTARLASQQVQLRVQEAAALAIADARANALQAVDRHLRQELDTISAAVDEVANGQPAAPFAGVNESLARITAYLDGMTPWVKADAAGAEAGSP